MMISKRLSLALSAVAIAAAPFYALAQAASDPAAPAETELAASAPSVASVPHAQAMPEARVQEIRQRLAASSDGDEHYRLLGELSRGYFADGRVADSQRVRIEIVDDSTISAGKRSIAASGLSMTFALSEDHLQSDRMVARAKRLASETTPAELETLPREPGYAYLATEAEIARRFQHRHDVALLKYREHSELAWRNFNDASLSERRRRAAANEMLDSVAELTRVMIQNNRRMEALSYATEVQWYIDHRPDLKPTPPQRAIVDLARALALCSFDDYDAALGAIDSSIAIYRKMDLPEHDGRYAHALRTRLMIALAMGRIEAYRADAEALDRGRAINPVISTSFGTRELDSLSLAARGDWAAASARIGEQMAFNLRSEGIGSPYYKYRAAMQMLYRLDDPNAQVTRDDIERYATPLTGSAQNWADTATDGAYDEDGALVACIDRLLRPGESAQSGELAFRIAELMHMNATQGVMTDGAARVAASDPALRGLVEQEQLLRHDQNTSRALFARAANKLDGLRAHENTDARVIARQTDEVEQRGKELRAEAAKLQDLHQEIGSRFPAYRELRSPAIPAPAQLGAALHANEVYVDLYAGRNASYAFVVQPQGTLQTFRLSVTRAQLRKMVAALRAGFDAGIPPQRPGDSAAFDLAAASQLYQALIAPIRPALGNATTIYLATNGVLASVPFNVLITRPATTLSTADWWINAATPVQIPSASALVLERGQNGKRAGTPLIAFANPSFDGNAVTPAGGATARDVRERAFADAGSLADFDYRRVTPLPETLDEARSIASALGAPPASVIWGAQASRSRVIKQDLSDDRVVLFATHGLIAGEVPGLRQPGLALAYEGTGLADSILMVDDIVPLRLNADWVVLSACNTGFASGVAGDSISALARGFFAAGARSLLVTQWSVESRSAQQLTVSLFNAYGADPTLSKADALARAERDMLNGKSGALYRHPYFWAAYFLTGDAAR